jgi:hypothetical protein
MNSRFFGAVEEAESVPDRYAKYHHSAAAKIANAPRAAKARRRRHHGVSGGELVKGFRNLV